MRSFTCFGLIPIEEEKTANMESDQILPAPSTDFLPCACLLSHIQLFATLWTVAHQASLSMEFSRQEYWNRLPFSTPGIFPTQGLSPLAFDILIAFSLLMKTMLTLQCSARGTAPQESPF